MESVSVALDGFKVRQCKNVRLRKKGGCGYTHEGPKLSNGKIPLSLKCTRVLKSLLPNQLMDVLKYFRIVILKRLASFFARVRGQEANGSVFSNFPFVF